MNAAASSRVFVGVQRVAAIPTGDRGFAYGDGLFETMRAHQGDVPWWDAHWARLQRGAARLRIALPNQRNARGEATDLLDGGDGVLKLIVSRGSGGRGYAPGAASAPTWTLSRYALPAEPASNGLTLRWCATQLAVQPLLAGIKHCNRLEQVLARAEWDGHASQDHTSQDHTSQDHAPQDPAADDGLMCSTDGDVVCATSANVFVLAARRWITPRVDRCGVAGICRGWVLSALGADEARLSAADIESADAVFLCNAVRGILPVARLGAVSWSPHPALAALQRRLSAAHPAFIASPPESP